MNAILSKAEIARLVKSGAMRYPDRNAPPAKPPAYKSIQAPQAAAEPRVEPIAIEPDKFAQVKVSEADLEPEAQEISAHLERDLRDYKVLEKLVNDALEEVAKTVEADRDHLREELAPGLWEGNPQGIIRGYDRAITLIRAAKKS